MKSICACCGKPRRERADSPGNYAGAHGWCEACTSRWYRAGCPQDGPPPPMSHAQRCAISSATRTATAARRAAEYARLRGIGCTPAQAALRLGLRRTAGRDYESSYLAAAEAAKGEAA